MQVSFTKMNGAGNDFVMLDNRQGNLSLEIPQIARLCDRHRGIGADGLLMVEPAEKGADFRMRYYNADGGEAEMCGNGARCFARFAQRVSLVDKPSITFETQAGVISADFLGKQVRIVMSEPHSHLAPQTLEVDGLQMEVHSINTGVPHAVVFVDDVERTNVFHNGAVLRHHAAFSPKGTNANFVQALPSGELIIRTYERGVEDETLACGTGVCAAALLHHARTGAASPVSVKVRGGETMQVGFEVVSGQYHNVTLTGPAEFVFDGTITL